MAKKVLLLVAVVCLLVPFMVLGCTVSADEVIINNTDLNYGVRINSAITRYQLGTGSTSGIYTWTGSPQFSLNFSDFSSNVTQVPFLLPRYSTSRDTEWGLVVNNSSNNYIGSYDFIINAGFKFSQTSPSSRSISFTIEDDFVHTFLVLVSYTGQDEQDVISLSQNVSSQYSFDGLTFSQLGIYPYEMEMSFESIEVGLGRYHVYDIDQQYELHYLSPIVEEDGTNGFLERNRFYTLRVDCTRGTHVFSGTSSSNGYVLAIFDWSTFGDEYYRGYYEGLRDGRQQADNTVNKNSASYQQGLTDGRADGQEYTFLGLIGAVIDAPINALFGHTTVDGVFHPGLFSIEILGMDMSAFILSIFTLGLIIAILRLCLGGK